MGEKNGKNGKKVRQTIEMMITKHNFEVIYTFPFILMYKLAKKFVWVFR